MFAYPLDQSPIFEADGEKGRLILEIFDRFEVIRMGVGHQDQVYIGDFNSEFLQLGGDMVEDENAPDRSGPLPDRR